MINLAAGPIMIAFIILGYYTILYTNNIIFRITQRICMGTSLAYYFLITLDRLNNEGIQPALTQSILIIPLILGCLNFARLTEKYGWLARYPTAFLLGMQFGIIGTTTIKADILNQVDDTLSAFMEADILSKINALVVLIGVLTVLIYFIYTLKITRPVNMTMTVGRYFLMAALGAGAADFTAGLMSWAIDPISRVVYEFFQLG